MYSKKKNYIQDVIDLYATSDAEKPSNDDFHRWLSDKSHAADKDQALRQLWENTEAASDANTVASLESLKLKVQIKALQKKNTRLKIWRYAACIALLLSLSLSSAYIFTREYSQAQPENPVLVEYFTGFGNSETLTLPDGSTIQTNSGSLLVYPDNFGTTNRTLYLSGEAYFKVAKNEALPFIVKSKYMSVEALGTEFNVSAYANDHKASTVLITGSVKVTTPASSEGLLLQKGEQLSYNKQQQTIARQEVDMDEATAWQRGELIFRAATIPEILRVLERRYDVTVHYRTNTVSADKFNFHFKKETSFSDIMEIITTVAGKFNYTITDNS
jgi:ferric-dicitrate binding protein FerR (iron transport regulator)